MPTVYQDRASISLYDAQYATGVKAAIPADVIASVVSALVRFKSTCADFDCTDVRILATEATREAINSTEFRKAINDATGWTVELLPKEEEGQIGALGVASSCASIHGMVMDLGGGSTQLTWVSTRDGEMQWGEGGSVSLPFGAAALMRRIEAAEQSGPAATSDLTNDVQEQLSSAYASLRSSTATSPGADDEPFNLFLSGGGFRGWGYLLMSSHAISPYPIPIINGFEVSASCFRNTASVTALAAAALTPSTSVFRVSDRRASQVPAVALLVSSLVAALPSISTVRFCQGGVREGALFAALPSSTRAQHPLRTATSPYAPPSSPALAALLAAAIPADDAPRILAAIAPSLAHLMFAHAALPKETRAAAALHAPTTGLLAGAHGVSHTERAALALALAERWGADVAPTDEAFLHGLRALVGPRLQWWTAYLGRVAALLGDVYPAGTVRGEKRVDVSATWEAGVLVLEVGFARGVQTEGLAKVLGRVEKVGQRKRWVGGRDGWGVKVDVRISGGHGRGLMEGV